MLFEAPTVFVILYWSLLQVIFDKLKLLDMLKSFCAAESAFLFSDRDRPVTLPSPSRPKAF